MQRKTFALLGLAFTAAISAAAAQVVGPMVGQVGDSEARFLYRPDGVVKNLRLSVLTPDGTVVGTSEATSAAANDYATKFHVTGLSPHTNYRYRIDEIAGQTTTPVVEGTEYRFRTFPSTGQRTVFTAAFAACAKVDAEPIWQTMTALKPDALFFMGDTPYIDTSTLATVRQKHRDFLITPNLKALIRKTPVIGTWDDHDFGGNNLNGVTHANKSVNRDVFVAYRANNQFGTGLAGIYNKADCGPIEVFLLDPRWFSATSLSPNSPAGSSQPTCFGAAQIDWIKTSLKTSKAPFKVLAFGEIWQDKKNSENDDMQTYWYERDALLDFIRDEKIPGVVLLGGDIHVSRYLLHPNRVGYDLHDFVTSPSHTSVIDTLNVYNPDLEWAMAEGNQFLTLTADTRVQPATLTANFYQGTSTTPRKTVAISYAQLVPQTGTGLGKELRGYWPMDLNTSNQSLLGTRIDATTGNGGAFNANDTVRAGAAALNRASNQYLYVGRSILPENAAQYTASIWAKPASLPAHGSNEKFFLLESTPAGTTPANVTYLQGSVGNGISLSLEAGSTADKVKVVLKTFTLKPASGNTLTAPTDLAQGPFSTEVLREDLWNLWSHFVVTFDSYHLGLTLNGQVLSSFALPTPGPLAETGGLVIGGDRTAGANNFNGLIDEVAIWSRVLTSEEITSLWNDGAPSALSSAAIQVDTDGDQLPDWWEITQGLDPNLASDATSDTDGDNVPAFVEFALGTSVRTDDTKFYNYIRQIVAPNRPADATAFRDPSGQITVRLVLETSTDMKTWTTVPLDAPNHDIEAINNLLQLKLPPPGGVNRYYRFQAKIPTQE